MMTDQSQKIIYYWHNYFTLTLVSKYSIKFGFKLFTDFRQIPRTKLVFRW